MKATKKVLYSNLLPPCLVVRVGKYEKLKFCTDFRTRKPKKVQKKGKENTEKIREVFL
jgi:hypothetical protein